MFNQIFEALQTLSTPEKAESMPYYFKTGKGEYGEGDLFLGVSVPDQRAVAKDFYKKSDFTIIQELLESKYHECRLTALLILVAQFEKSKDADFKEKLVQFYLKNTEYINNWDLVDTSCYKILGRYSFENSHPEILQKLSKSDKMWEKRMAVVGTMYYIKKGQFDLTKEFVLRNLNHPHDLMHKANGWLLREMGKINEEELLEFLKKYYHEMPRTCLRYAIEKLDMDLRQDFLKGNI